MDHFSWYFYWEIFFKAWKPLLSSLSFYWREWSGFSDIWKNMRVSKWYIFVWTIPLNTKDSLSDCFYQSKANLSIFSVYKDRYQCQKLCLCGAICMLSTHTHTNTHADLTLPVASAVMVSTSRLPSFSTWEEEMHHRHEWCSFLCLCVLSREGGEIIG